MFKYRRVKKANSAPTEERNGRFIVCLDKRVELLEGIAAVCEATFRMYDPATRQYEDLQ